MASGSCWRTPLQEFLAFEQAWLLDPWPSAKIALSALVALSMAAFCAALWLRSLRRGLAVLAAMALAKIVWSVTAGGTSGTATVVPALAGLLVGGVAIAVLIRRITPSG